MLIGLKSNSGKNYMVGTKLQFLRCRYFINPNRVKEATHFKIQQNR